MANSQPSSHTLKPYFHSAWHALGYTTVFSVSIATLLWILEVASPWWSSVLVSLSIGWSINLAFLFLGTPLARLIAPPMTPIPIVAIGLLAGLVIAGSMLFGEPLHFITRDYYSLLLGIFFGVIGFAIFGTRARLMEARAELALAATQHEAQEKLLLETELKLLQAQIEPHFLFNTLSNVVGLIRKEPDVAEQTLLNLTTLLRAFLKRTREESSSLAEELEIIRAYLDIQSIRMRGRLSYTVAADDAVGHTQLPPLLVQPLVENAIKHGIDPAEDGGAVDVTAHLVGQDLLIEVADTGIGFDDSAGGNGTGLGNVRNRLRALYGDRASMTITEREPRGVAVTLTLPATEP